MAFVLAEVEQFYDILLFFRALSCFFVIRTQKKNFFYSAGY